MNPVATADEVTNLVAIQRDKLTTAKTIRITDAPLDDGATAHGAAIAPRVFAIADDGSAVELTMITKISWVCDIDCRAEATLTFVNVQLDVSTSCGTALPLELVPVEPNGTVSAIGCKHSEDGDGMEADVISLPTWPATAEATTLRLLRTAKRMSVAHASERLGVSAVEYSSLERGKNTLSQSDWRWVHMRIAGTDDS